MTGDNDLRALSDDVLVSSFRTTRENRFFEEIHTRHPRDIYLKTYGFLNGNHEYAADLTQDVFLRALEYLHTYQGGNLGAWLTSIARGLCINFIRSAARRREVAVAELPESDHEPRCEFLSSELLTAVNGLPAPQRLCLKLWAEGYTYIEIAKVMGLPGHTVRSHIQNGKLRLRQTVR